MILTRCPQPECQTTFRVTPEQLKARGGKVRCGQCQHVFNALEHLLDEGGEEAASLRPAAPPAGPVDAGEVELATAATATSTAPAGAMEADLQAAVPENGDTPDSQPDTLEDDRQEPILDASAIEEPNDAPVLADAGAAPADLAHDPEDPILPRETTAIPGYSKWAERPLAGGGALMAEPARKPRWPFLLAILILFSVLLGQMAHRFRSDLAIALPSLQPLMLAAGWDIPLPRKAELVSIEASDLQADAAKGQLILMATLKNRAPYVQDLPALELALTDTQDAVVSRRVLHPADYLTGTAAPAGFQANGEIPVKLWIEAKDLVPSGYRLYVFYP